MLVDGCNLAYVTAGEMKTYSVATHKSFLTFIITYLTFYLNTFKIYHPTLLPFIDIVRFWIFIFYNVV